MQFYSNHRPTLILPPIQIRSFLAQRHPFHILETDPFPISAGLFLLTLLTPRNTPLHEVDLLGLPCAEVIYTALFSGLALTAVRRPTLARLQSLQGAYLQRCLHSFFPKLSPILCTVPPAVQKAAEEVAPQANSTSTLWWVGVGLVAGVCFFATGGLAAVAAGTTTTAMSASGALASIGGGVATAFAPTATIGGTAFAIITSTTPTALAMKTSLITGGMLMYYFPTTREVVNATNFHQLLLDSGMPEHVHRVFLKNVGVLDITKIPRNYPVSFTIDERTLTFGHLENGKWVYRVVENMNYTEDVYRRLAWIGLRIAQKVPPADLLPPPARLRYFP